MKINREKLEYDVENILYLAHFGNGRRKVSKEIVAYIMDKVDAEIGGDVTKSWDMFHDFPEELNGVVRRLEKGLMLNMFPKDENAKAVYRWILEQEQEGRKLETWTKWAMHPDRIKFVFMYRKDPRRIAADYPQAFLGENREVYKAPEDTPKVITPDMLRRNG